MPAPATTRGWALPAAGLVTYVLLEVLRVWLPALRLGLRDGAAPLWLLGVVLLACLAAPLLALPLVATGRSRGLWRLGVTVLVACRLLLQAPLPAGERLTVASAGVIAGVAALAALAGGGPDPRAALLGGHVGLTLNVTGHLALRTEDVIWSQAPPALAVTATLVLALLVAARGLRDDPGWDLDRAGPPGWAWLAVGPIALLTLVLSSAPGRTAIAVGWPSARIAAVLAAAHLTGLLLALSVGANDRRWPGTVAGGLVLVGTAGGLQPVGMTAVAAQALLAIGLGLLVGASATATTAPPTTPTPGWPVHRSYRAASLRAGTAIGGWLLLGGLVLAYHGAYDLTLPLPNRLVLLLTAAGLALVGALATRAARRRWAVAPAAQGAPTRSSATVGSAATVGSGAILVALVALAVGWTASVPAIDPPRPGTSDTLTVVQLNLRSGFDAEGRFAVGRAAATLRDLDADVVLLSEVDRGWLLHGGHDVLRLLAAELGLATVFAPAADEVWGNAVLSRYPLEEITVERLPRGNAPMTRSQLAAVVALTEDARIAVVATHLSLRVGPEDGTRLAQARAVAATVARFRERGLPVVVGGTLNAPGDSAELETFEPLARPLLPPGTPSWPADEPTEERNHLLASDELRRLEVGVVDVRVSDHRPLLVTLRLVAPD